MDFGIFPYTFVYSAAALLYGEVAPGAWTTSQKNTFYTIFSNTVGSGFSLGGRQLHYRQPFLRYHERIRFD